MLVITKSQLNVAVDKQGMTGRLGYIYIHVYIYINTIRNSFGSAKAFPVTVAEGLDLTPCQIVA